MKTFCCLMLVVLSLVYDINCSYSKKVIYITKHNKHQRMSASSKPDKGYWLITGLNKKHGEIPYFTGYSSREKIFDRKDGWAWGDRYCYFDRQMFVYTLRSATVLSDKQSRDDGFENSGVSVFVSRDECKNTVKIYYAMCGTGESRYGRVGISYNLCGNDKKHYEHHFYAYAGKPLCKALTRPRNTEQWTPTYEGPRIVQYTCGCRWGYERKGPHEIHCKDSGRWNSIPPSCSAIKCKALSNPPKGRLSTSDRTYGTSVTYICNHGYQLDPSDGSIKCDGYGSWSENAHISCKPVDCGYPMIPSNGNVQKGLKTTFEHIAKVYCERNHKLEGATAVKCGADGRWKYNGEQPSCKEIKCPHLTHPKNGRAVMNGRSVGDQASFTCKRGYKQIGSQTITCQRQENTGKWSDDLPTCTVLTCDPPAAPKDGQVLGKLYTYGAEIRFICNPGFQLRGADRATCRISGWDTVTSTCTGIKCRDPGTPKCGSRDTESFGFGVVVTFKCGVGYRRNGPESITCEDNGHWSGRRPQCEPMECPQLYPPRYGTRDGDQREYPANVTFTCYPGYEMKGDGTILCQATGKWSSPVPTCTACAKGYYRNASQPKCTKCPSHSTTTAGASTSLQQCTCTEGSKGPQGGPCTVVECDMLSDPKNGKILPCNRIQDSECEAQCDAGYILSGTRRRRCTAEGWTGKPAVCTACPRNTYKMHTGSTACQPCPSNMVTKPGVPAHTKKACVCASGYQSVGHGKPCSDINECLVNNGGCKQLCENTEGSYTCSCSIPGYQLEADGRTCTMKKTCPLLDQKPKHGFLKCRYTERTNGYICFMKCTEGYFFVSGENDYVTCGAGTEFEWSHRRVNKTARIPACTREFFIDISLPMTLKYKGSGSCSSNPISGSVLWQKLKKTINTIPQCRNKCIIHDVTLDCSGRGTDKFITVRGDIIIYNPHPDEVPLNCSSTCKRESMISMLRDAFAVATKLKNVVQTNTEMLELPNALSIDVKASLASNGITGKPQMLCNRGKVLTKTRLCVPCDRGFYLPRRDLTMCEPCPKGTYQDEEGQIRCKPCLPGSTTVSEGSDHPAMCNVKADQEIKSQRRNQYEVTEDNAAAILDDPMFGL